MKVLLLAHGTPLCLSRVASGNSVRAYYLARGLEANGINVIHVCPASVGDLATEDLPEGTVRAFSYRNSHELRRTIAVEKPDA